MNNFRRGLHSQAGAGAKTGLAAFISKLKHQTGLTKLVHFWGR
jgi:hypothetical protein